jgi:hypothetical protein
MDSRPLGTILRAVELPPTAVRHVLGQHVRGVRRTPPALRDMLEESRCRTRFHEDLVTNFDETFDRAG